MSPYPSRVPWCQSTPLGRPVVPPVYQSRRSSPERSIRGAGACGAQQLLVGRVGMVVVELEEVPERAACGRVRRPHARGVNGGTRARRRRRSRRAARARRPGSGSSRSPAPRAASRARTGTPCTPGSCGGRARPGCRGRHPAQPTPPPGARRGPRPRRTSPGGRPARRRARRGWRPRPAPTPWRSSRTRRHSTFRRDLYVRWHPYRGAVRGRRRSRRATTRRSRRTRPGRRWRTQCPCP